MEDEAIIELFYERKETAIDETKGKYGRRLYRIARNILQSNEDAEECVNDALLKAWEAIPPSRPEKFGAYMAKITRNLAINKWEAKSAAKRGGGEVNLLLSELEDCIASAANLEETYEASLVTEAINSFLGASEKAARLAFVLRYFHGESILSISQNFQMSESKVKSMLFRMRKKLKLQLEKEGITI